MPGQPPHQMQMPPGASPPQHAVRFGPPGAIQRPPGPPGGPPGPQIGMQPQPQPRPPMPRPLFHGHDPGTKRKSIF